ncbi:TIGR02679 family protein [Pseudonocardia saturnea]
MSGLPTVVADPALVPLWKAVHERLSSGRPVSTILVTGLDDAGRAAVADLFGMDRLPGADFRVTLSRLDAVLREATGTDARAVVRHVIGPVGNRVAQREEAAAERDELWSWLRGHVVVREQPILQEWVDGLRRAGAPSVPAARALVEQALAVLARLPADGQPLPSFADAVLNSPHALDEGTRAGALVLRAVATMRGVPPPSSAEDRRRLWEEVGVSEDQLSVSVLAAGLHPAGAGVLATMLRACAAAGHAAAVTLAQLRDPGDWTYHGGGVVHVVENPSVLALALNRFGNRCPPLVCTSGWPNSAGIMFLRRLSGAGQEVRYHGDLDGDGVRIAAYVLAKVGAQPWRMSASDYSSAVAADAIGPPVGRVSGAPWDVDLAPLMISKGVAVVEERVSHLLLDDLGVSMKEQV